MDNMSFVLFGGTGDLARRKIYPALFNLYTDQKMPESFSIIAMGRKEQSHADFQQIVAKSLQTFSRRTASDPAVINAFLASIRYSSLNVNHVEDYHKLRGVVESREKELSISGNRIFYLSVAPEFFETIAFNLQESRLTATTGWKRLIIEKPFGRDLESARHLNRALGKVFDEEEIYRIDHYLGKPMVQNLEILESSNPILKALWSNHHIANVQITASETVGVEERAGYYDHSGAIRDMVQNHMLQLLMMISMRLPCKSDASEVRMKKRSIMESLRPLNKETIANSVIRGQYTAGEIQGKPVQGYTDEPGVPADSKNDTFIALRLWIDNYFWSDVPFYIRTGKRMKEKSTRIVIEFKEPLKGQTTANDPNLLVVEINPNEGIFIQLNKKDPMNHEKLEPIRVNFFSNEKELPEAYENLIFDAIRGDSTFFAHWDEVELSWEYVQPILDAFEQDSIPLSYYPAGSNGPEASNKLAQADGFKWWLDKPEDAEQAGQKEEAVLAQV
ncbi:glucose-6-phosphate dehydrogenase [Paenibacillus sp.]|jgi:glucose-6-phosphate 1-dehydrogenase|uniref:glucose-6-phosphate dehydrogenase n=1 Tax=Paenibacillus sp. TaxID=58172 RepID=UPI002819426B|nr:glucose-6-phosphate dehydrogenase [Paenibacillus sp.]MDR0267324.1 glucose-6-phosphate dehydrogenase [Paenibacillus sp.]